MRVSLLIGRRSTRSVNAAALQPLTRDTIGRTGIPLHYYH